MTNALTTANDAAGSSMERNASGLDDAAEDLAEIRTLLHEAEGKVFFRLLL